VPMLLAGDEIGQTQRGNNNAYCQDNELTWIDWEHADQDLLQFTVAVLTFRRAHPVFRRRRWFQGRPLRGREVRDIAWFTPAGHEMSEQDWTAGFAKSLMVFLNGQAIPSRGPRSEAIVDDSFLLCFNAHYEPLTFTLPGAAYGRRWQPVIDTADPNVQSSPQVLDALGILEVESRSVVVLQAGRGEAMGDLAGDSLLASRLLQPEGL
jgi:isoamylase